MSSLLQSPDWSHVANPSRCQFCRSEYHLSSDELYPEPAAIQLALTQLPRNHRPKCRGYDDAIIGSGLEVQGQLDSIGWLTGDEGCRWTDSAAETIDVQSQLSGDDRSTITCVDSGSGTGFRGSSVSRLELSDLVPADCRIGRWDDKIVEKSRIRDMERRQSDTPRRRSGGGEDREWVVRRRSDGSRYIRRRSAPAERRRRSAETRDHRADPARRSWPRPTVHLSPGTIDQQHGCPGNDRSCDAKREIKDVIRTTTKLDRWNNAGYDDYGTVEWICSPHCTDSSYRIVAVV